MTIEDKLTTIGESLQDIKEAIINKGQTVTGNITTYADKINDIQSGVTPSGTLSITANGTYDVTNYASANVSVAEDSIPMFPKYNFAVLEDGSVSGLFTLTGDVDDDGNPIANVLTDTVNGDISYAIFNPDGSYEYRGIIDVDTDNPIIHLSLGAVTAMDNDYSISFDNVDYLSSVDLSGIVIINNSTSVDFDGSLDLTSVDLSSLTTLNGYLSSSENSKLTNIDLSSLTTVSGSLDFRECTNLTSIDLPSLTTVSGDDVMQGAFRGCTGLTRVDLSGLTTVSGDYAMQVAFSGCTSLTSLSFPSLTSTSFGSYTNQFSGMLDGVTGCTVHFPSNLQSVIGSWSDVTAGFGGTNTTVLFDLPATT